MVWEMTTAAQGPDRPRSSPSRKPQGKAWELSMRGWWNDVKQKLFALFCIYCTCLSYSYSIHVFKICNLQRKLKRDSGRAKVCPRSAQGPIRVVKGIQNNSPFFQQGCMISRWIVGLMFEKQGRCEWCFHQTWTLRLLGETQALMYRLVVVVSRQPLDCKETVWVSGLGFVKILPMGIPMKHYCGKKKWVGQAMSKQNDQNSRLDTLSQTILQLFHNQKLSWWQRCANPPTLAKRHNLKGAMATLWNSGITTSVLYPFVLTCLEYSTPGENVGKPSTHDNHLPAGRKDRGHCGQSGCLQTDQDIGRHQGPEGPPNWPNGTMMLAGPIVNSPETYGLDMTWLNFDAQLDSYFDQVSIDFSVAQVLNNIQQKQQETIAPWPRRCNCRNEDVGQEILHLSQTFHVGICVFEDKLILTDQQLDVLKQGLSKLNGQEPLVDAFFHAIVATQTYLGWKTAIDSNLRRVELSKMWGP